MNHSDFLDRMNQQYFDGALAPLVLERLAALPVERADVRGFVERAFSLMRQAGLPATDVSPFQGELLGSLIARLLPGTWGGRVPPITVAGRHRRFDLLVERLCGAKGRMLDIACGFPPFTSVDSALALPGWDIVGVDRALPEFLLEDGLGNYASFNADGEVQYFQPIAPTKESWEALLGDYDGSKRRLEGLFARLRAGRPAPAGASLVQHPVTEYERDNLRFVRADLDVLSTEPADAVRCFNMLMYFDAPFRARAVRHFTDLLRENGLLVYGVDWAFSMECRYVTRRKRDGQLETGEFAFSLDNLMPIGIIGWYTLQPDEPEALMLASLCRILRNDRDFLRDFVARADALRLESGVCPRQPDGYVADVSADIPPADVWTLCADFSARLNETFAARAAAVLTAAGHASRVNEIGHVAVTMS
jgi:SAM-dependent methyltransferase